MEFNAFVLKSKWLGNNLKQLNLFGEKIGRIDLIVKVEKGEFPLKYETFSLSKFRTLNFEGKFKVLNCSLVKSFVPESFEHFNYLSSISRVYLRYVMNFNEKIFSLLNYYMGLRTDFDLAISMLIVKFCFFEGLFPEVLKCVSCGTSSIHAFSLKEGGAICKKCGSGEFTWNRDLGLLSFKLLREPFRRLKGKAFALNHLRKVRLVFESHLRYRLGEK